MNILVAQWYKLSDCDYDVDDDDDDDDSHALCHLQDGCTALMMSCEEGHLDVAQFLVDEEVDVWILRIMLLYDDDDDDDDDDDVSCCYAAFIQYDDKFFNNNTSYLRCIIYSSLFLIFRKTTRGKGVEDGCRDVLYVLYVCNKYEAIVTNDQ